MRGVAATIVTLSAAGGGATCSPVLIAIGQPGGSVNISDNITDKPSRHACNHNRCGGARIGFVRPDLQQIEVGHRPRKARMKLIKIGRHDDDNAAANSEFRYPE